MPVLAAVRRYPSAFIPDGYQETAYLAGVEGLHPPVTFQYRPMTARAGIELFQVYQKGGPAEKAEAVLRAIEQVQAWDLEDAAGGPVACTREAKGRLTQTVANSMAMIVMGVGVSDRPPGQTPAEDMERSAQATNSLLRGTLVAEQRELNDAGNS